MGRISEESEGYVSENLKLKESVGEDEKYEILRVNKGIKEKFPSIEKLELETLNEVKDKVEEFLDDVLAVDFAVPAEQYANLLGNGFIN
nr:stress-response A/B barrel domain-containing protein UP3-like [Ipomoea trifida]